jgi:RNA polymerase sigma-70 factor (ECF subfamily)
MELLEQFAHGDLDAFETLFRQFQAPVYGWILRLVRNPATAEDLTIETFWRIHRAHARFDPARDFGPWAHRIALHVALNHLKRAPAETPLSFEPSIRPAFADPDTGRAVRAAFARLPERLQQVAALALIEERPYAEVAGTLGLTVAAVKSRMFRAVRLLRDKLKHLGVPDAHTHR